MPWEKQFNHDEALSKAMGAFWAHGYQATSMQDLINFTGINRGSLSASFGDKRRLPRVKAVPQIFIDGEHIGGYEDLRLLDQAGRLQTR